MSTMLRPTRETVKHTVIEGLALLAFFAVLALLAGCGEVESAEVTAKIVAEVDEKKADAKFQLLHPLQCDAWVMYSGTPGELPRTRCYVRPE
jgi:hypothetical protein